MNRLLSPLAAVTLFVGVGLGAPSQASTDQDAAAIEATARNYIEGWFEGDETRMEKALWRDLAKRIVASELGIDQVDIVQTTALELVQQTRAKSAQPIPKGLDIVILDRLGNAASVRVDAGAWVDYMHVAKIHGEWKIVNVLWELKPSQQQ